MRWTRLTVVCKRELLEFSNMDQWTENSWNHGKKKKAEMWGFQSHWSWQYWKPTSREITFSVSNWDIELQGEKEKKCTRLFVSSGTRSLRAAGAQRVAFLQAVFYSSNTSQQNSDLSVVACRAVWYSTTQSCIRSISTAMRRIMTFEWAGDSWCNHICCFK